MFYYPKCYISINCKLACEIFETCEFFVTLSAGDLRSAANYYIKASRELAIPSPWGIQRGKNIDVTPALKDYVEKKITKVTKQFKTVGDISAVLKVEKGNHIVEITVPASGILLRAQETTKDMYSSIDLVIEKIERQIHKYKTRLMKRKYNNFQDAVVPASVETVAEDDGEFKIIKNKSFAMHPMTAEEAILQMNLLNHDFFVFYDPDFGGVNVVYRRKDGNYGLLAPELK